VFALSSLAAQRGSALPDAARSSRPGRTKKPPDGGFGQWRWSSSLPGGLA